MVLNFDEIIFAAKDLDEAAAGLPRLCEAIVQEMLRHHGGEAAGKANQTLRVAGEGFEIGARFIIKALQMGIGD